MDAALLPDSVLDGDRVGVCPAERTRQERENGGGLR